MKILREQLTKHLPPVFAATELDNLTGGALRWRTVQNIRSKREPADYIPKECFLRDGKRKILIVRDSLLDWWLPRLRSDSFNE